MRNQAVALGAVVALIAVNSAQPGRAEAQFSVCTRETVNFGNAVIDHHHPMRRSTVGNFAGDASWGTNIVEAYHRPWEGFWYLDTSNYAIWIESVTTGDSFTGWQNTYKAVERSQRQPGFGAMQPYFVWPSNALDHLDIFVSGPTTSAPGPRPSAAIATDETYYSASCVTPFNSSAVGAFTETGTLLHELSHGYGYDHMDNWVSIHNTSQIDTLSCELGTAPASGRSMFVTPDAYTTQCHDIVYTISNGIDLSLSPVTQPSGCLLANNPCATVPGGGLTTIPASSTSFSSSVTYTTLSNRDSVSGFVSVRVFLSQDRLFDASDILVHTLVTSNGWTAGATTRRTQSFTFNPQTLPFGVIHHALVVIDSNGVHAETRESNNVTDTNVRFLRL